MAFSLPSFFKNSFYGLYKTEVVKGLARYSTSAVLTEDDILHLPLCVQQYLRYTGSIGKPVLQNVRAVFKGEIRSKLNGPWMGFSSQQFNFFDELTRLFYMKAKMLGIPFTAFHAYVGKAATMQVKLLSFFKIVDARGEKMNQSETVTMFNDMCFLAPASLIHKSINWKMIDAFTAEARFTNKGITVAATLYFNERSELINFISSDRYLSEDGKTYTSYVWETPLSNYKDFEDRRIASYGEAIWKMPEGDFCYGKFNLQEVKFNATAKDSHC